MKFSFIIPVYKVELYLNQCVSSIVNQTYKDLEIILVDDGSPDNCPKMCDEWAKKDERITALHKKNGGLSDARNYGMKYANGEYVIFVDSDDYWSNNQGLKIISQRLEKQPDTDVLFFNVYYDFGNSNYVKWPEYKLAYKQSVTSTEAIKSLVESGTVPMTAWSKAVRRSVLVDNKIEFQLGIVGEDTPWFIDLMQVAKGVCFINEYLYAYRQSNATSITKTKSAQHAHDHMMVIEDECAKMPNRKADDGWKRYMYSFVAYNYCILMATFDRVEGEDRKDFWKFVKKYSFLLSYDSSPKVKKVHKMSRILGIVPTAYVLNYYLRHK